MIRGCLAWARLVAPVAATLCANLAMAQVTVADAWVRGTVEGQTSTAAYLKLHSDTDARLISVTSPAAARCTVHEMTMSGNVMRMRSLDSLPIPAGRAVALEEGHDHLMLEGLTHPLKPGEVVTLTLTFTESSTGKQRTIEVRAPVRPLGASGADDQHSTMPMTR